MKNKNGIGLNTESQLITGAVGPLEVLCELPDGALESIAIICHPHPLYEGTMHNKVAYMLARTLKQNKSVAVRFNFRGVGQSAGEHADGVGEVADVLAVMAWAQNNWPNLPVILAGFSFGSYVALLVSQNLINLETYNIQRLITVAPPVGRWDFTEISEPTIPWLVVQGTNDELVDAQQVKSWCDKMHISPELAEIPAADHFFHGKLTKLRDAVQLWLDDGNKI